MKGNLLIPNIIIVSPIQYSDLARRISHEISKKEITSSYWTVEQFIANEISTSGKQHAIFIGNPKENDLTKAYFPTIKSNLPDNNSGVFCGFDGSKAIAFGDGNLKQVSEFEKLFIAVQKNRIEVEGEDSGTKNSISYIVAGIVLGAIGLGFMGAFKWWNNKKKEEKLRKAQTELALALFFIEGFNCWLNIKKEVTVENQEEVTVEND